MEVPPVPPVPEDQERYLAFENAASDFTEEKYATQLKQSERYVELSKRKEPLLDSVNKILEATPAEVAKIKGRLAHWYKNAEHSMVLGNNISAENRLAYRNLTMINRIFKRFRTGLHISDIARNVECPKDVVVKLLCDLIWKNFNTSDTQIPDMYVILQQLDLRKEFLNSFEVFIMDEMVATPEWMYQMTGIPEPAMIFAATTFYYMALTNALRIDDLMRRLDNNQMSEPEYTEYFSICDTAANENVAQMLAEQKEFQYSDRLKRDLDRMREEAARETAAYVTQFSALDEALNDFVASAPIQPGMAQAIQAQNASIQNSVSQLANTQGIWESYDNDPEVDIIEDATRNRMNSAVVKYMTASEMSRCMNPQPGDNIFVRISTDKMIPYVNGKYISKVPGGSFIKSISGKEFTVDDVNVALAEKPKGKCHAGTRVSARIGAQQLCSKAIRTGWYSGTVLECMNDKRTGKPCYTVLFDGDFTINIGIDHVRVLVEQPLEVNPRKRTSEGVHYQLAYKNCWQLQPKGSNIRFFMRAYMEAYPDWEKMRMPERENFKRVAVENKRGLPCSAIRLQLDNGCALMRFPKGTENCTKWPCAEHEHEDEWMFRGDPRFLALNENRLMFENAKISEMGGESSSDSGISMMPATPSSRRHRVQNLPVERATRSSTPEAAVAPGRKVQTARKTSRRAASARNHKKPSKEVNRQIQQTNKDTMERECEFILHDLPEWAERYCRFEPHDECGKKCIEQIRERDPAHVSYHNMSPYLIPLKCGWSRVRLCTTLKQKGAPRLSRIIYQAPCGESYYDFASVFKFLQLSGSLLTIDLFTFEEQLDLLVYAQPRKEYVKSPDFCQDMENIRIPVLNSTRPEEPIPTLIYSRVSRPGRITSDVPERERFLTQSKEFCSGCSCVDDCSDPTKCDCLKLNISTMERLFETLRIDQIGYKHKLISEIACAGIFECNDNCKCHRNRESKKKCLNTVVQLDMKFPLQLFRTPECGWGVRTTVDIPKGAFIANYCGDIYTDAEIEAHPMPDDYYADLDLVDSVENEKRKQGIDLIGLDENEVPHKRKRSTKNDAGKVKFSFDDYFKEGGDHLFIVDAMKRGNIGKFFNHSCNPNMFVQHVLVDTHDIRLPWVSFFAKRHIHAGDELCWNYGYQIGTITNKFLYCKCGSNKCEGRLL